MLGALCALSSREIPQDCWHGVRCRIVSECENRNGRRSWLSRPLIAVPALALAVLLAVLVWWPSRVHNQEGAGLVSAKEYCRYAGAHSRLESVQPMADPDVSFISAKLDTSSPTYSVQP